MQEIRRIYLDANILIAFIEPKDEIGFQIRAVIAHAPQKMPTFFATSELTFAETLVEPYRRRDEGLIRSYENWSFNNGILQVGPVTREILYCAAVLRAEHTGLKLPDAIHLATAFAFDCSHILTADKGFRERYVLLHDHYGSMMGGAREIVCLRPDAETLSALMAAG